MDLWYPRERSLEWFKSDLKSEAKIITRGFELIDQCILKFEEVSEMSSTELPGRFGRVCAVTITKGKYLLLGCYSLCLDALGQEAGALLRPVIEIYELLVYFRLKPERVDVVINEQLPSAGNIAKAIGGKFHGLRNHLNANAAHFGLKFDSVRHVMDGKTLRMKKMQVQSPNVLWKNIQMVNAFQVFILTECCNCLFAVGMDANILTDRVEAWRNESLVAFKISG